MKEKVQAPELRFPGFTDDWEERKLSELATMNARIGWQNLRTSEFLDNGDYMLITGTDFKAGAIDYSNIHYVEKERFEQDKKIQISNKSILITKDGTLGKVAYVEGLTMPATLNAGVFNVKVKEDLAIDSKYLFHYLKAPFLLKFADQRSTGGTIKHLNQNVLVEFPIPLPSLGEQHKIAGLLSNFDNTIALHQRKLDLLKEQKKGYLQKMFPKNGAKVPELRFAGFADDWEERKLGEVFNQTVEYINPNEANLELWSVTVERGLTPKTARYNREALVKKNDKFKVVHDGDIVYNPMNLTIGAVGFNKSEKSVAVSGYYVTMNMNSGFNNSYFQTWLKSENAIKQYKLYATGSLIEKQRVQFPTLSLIKSYIPIFEEQQKIGSFFKQLDETIALHQRKLDLLKEQKKGFLQKMFV